MQLPEKSIAVTPKRMGRPPLGIISTTVRLPKAVLERIDALIGPNRRAQFIRQAVEGELKRREEGGAEPAEPKAPTQAAKPAPTPELKPEQRRGIVSGLHLPIGGPLKDPGRK